MTDNDNSFVANVSGFSHNILFHTNVDLVQYHLKLKI